MDDMMVIRFQGFEIWARSILLTRFILSINREAWIWYPGSFNSCLVYVNHKSVTEVTLLWFITIYEDILK
jgi:hypothetical protein